MKKINLIYQINGDEDFLENGLNIFEIAPTMLSIGQLIIESNKILFPGGREISVNVRPMKSGSHIIDIILFAKNNIQQVMDFISSEGIQQIKTVIETIGIISGASAGVGYTLLKLIKFVLGKPTKITKISEEKYRYTSPSGESIEVGSGVHNLFINSTIKGPIYGSFGKLLDENSSDRISSILTYINEKNTNGMPVSHGRDYLDSLKKYSHTKSSVIKTDVQPPIQVNLLLKKPDLLGNSQWDFMYAARKISTKILDEDFLKKVKRGKVKLYAGVKIPCLLQIEFDLDEDSNPVPESDRYTILQITGDIIEPSEIKENPKSIQTELQFQ